MEPLTAWAVVGIDFGRPFPCKFVELTFAIAQRQFWDGESRVPSLIPARPEKDAGEHRQDDMQPSVESARVQGSGFRIQGSGFRVQGSGFRVQGSECKIM